MLAAISVTADVVDSAAGSLRDAITAANANPGLDTILLAPGEYRLTRDGANEDENLTGDLDITTGVVRLIADDPETTIIDGGLLDRVSDVHEGASLEIDRVSIIRGTADEGGGIRNRGSLELSHSVVRDHHASFGGGIDNLGTLHVVDTTITNNSAIDGGGISGHSGDLNFYHSTITNNHADRNGGGISLDNSRAIRVISNSGRELFLCCPGHPQAVLQDSLVEANTACEQGGGIFVGSNGQLWSHGQYSSVISIEPIPSLIPLFVARIMHSEIARQRNTIRVVNLVDI